jgi:hypothetical protein
VTNEPCTTGCGWLVPSLIKRKFLHKLRAVWKQYCQGPEISSIKHKPQKIMWGRKMLRSYFSPDLYQKPRKGALTFL